MNQNGRQLADLKAMRLASKHMSHAAALAQVLGEAALVKLHRKSLWQRIFRR